jgi:stress-induced morphogen
MARLQTGCSATLGQLLWKKCDFVSLPSPSSSCSRPLRAHQSLRRGCSLNDPCCLPLVWARDYTRHRLQHRHLRRDCQKARGRYGASCTSSSPRQSWRCRMFRVCIRIQVNVSTPERLTWEFAGGCGSFYAISVTSSAFKEHRLVNDALKQEIEGIHGLQVRR